MRHTYYVPSKSSRHRIAALALYRALVRNGSKIEIAEDVPRGGPRHPVAHIIRRRFESHRNYTSLRLVYSAMASGYQFLTLFAKAQVEGSKEHGEVMEHLRNRRISPPRPKEEAAVEKPVKSPMITRITPDHVPAKYKPTYTPYHDPAKRRVPTMGAAAEGVPYLRFTKPQRPIVNKIIRRRRNLVIELVEKVKDLEEYTAAEAALEDKWEDLVEEHIELETGQAPPPREMEETYVWSAMGSRLWYEYKLQVLWDDMTAKGEAMWDIVELEKQHAEAKAGEDGGNTRHRRVVPLRTAAERGRKRIKVSQSRMMPILKEVHRIAAYMRKQGEGDQLEKQIDPFATPIWQKLHRNSTGRMVAWLSKTEHHDPSLLGGKTRGALEPGEEEDDGFASVFSTARTE